MVIRKVRALLFINTRTMNFYLKSFCIFSRIGLFTIGGGYAMIPLIEAEIIDKQKWVSREDFIDLMALAQTVPGIFAVNITTFIGYKLRKFCGAFFMALGIGFAAVRGGKNAQAVLAEEVLQVGASFRFRGRGEAYSSVTPKRASASPSCSTGSPITL